MHKQMVENIIHTHISTAKFG